MPDFKKLFLATGIFLGTLLSITTFAFTVTFFTMNFPIASMGVFMGAVAIGVISIIYKELG